MSEMHVVVTIASNGVVHAWGEGPVVGGEVEPFATGRRARAVAAQFRRHESRLAKAGVGGVVKVHVCKVLGIEPVTVEDRS